MSTEQQEDFRDRIATAETSGKRKWIYPKKPNGKFYDYRKWVSYFLLIFLFAAPIIKLNGEQLVLLNIIERKFVFFGFTFWPQDLYLFVFAMLCAIIMIILFTSIFGRLWCGWACPQTIFMEMLFRRIEYWIEGDASAQKRLDKQEWNAEKATKKISKHIIFFAISFLIANTFLAYIIGSDQLFTIISEPVSEHVVGFVSIVVFSLVFYGVFARFREQACVIVCPYGRFQSVMVDQDTFAVTYDFERGEPRGKFSKDQAVTDANGDCIDCDQCVKVCPTGIDIRHGIQLECVNCTACMDACDEVMVKVNREPGLIRYASYSSVEKKTRFHLTGRHYTYMTFLVIVSLIFTSLLFLRNDLDVIVLRQPGTLFQKVDSLHYSNLYTIKVLNKTDQSFDAKLSLSGIPGEVKIVGSDLTLKAQQSSEFRFFIILKNENLQRGSNPLQLDLITGDDRSLPLKTNFIAPDVL